MFIYNIFNYNRNNNTIYEWQCGAIVTPFGCIFHDNCVERLTHLHVKLTKHLLHLISFHVGIHYILNQFINIIVFVINHKKVLGVLLLYYSPLLLFLLALFLLLEYYLFISWERCFLYIHHLPKV